MGFLGGDKSYMLRKGYGMMEAERYKIVIDVCDELLERVEKGKIGGNFSWELFKLRGDAKIMLGDYYGALLDQENNLQILEQRVTNESSSRVTTVPKIKAALYKVCILKSALGMYGVAWQDLMEAKDRFDEFDDNLRGDINLLLKHMRCIGKVKCKYHNDDRDCEYDMLEKLRENIQNRDWSYGAGARSLLSHTFWIID